DGEGPRCRTEDRQLVLIVADVGEAGGDQLRDEGGAAARAAHHVQAPEGPGGRSGRGCRRVLLLVPNAHAGPWASTKSPGLPASFSGRPTGRSVVACLVRIWSVGAARPRPGRVIPKPGTQQ